MKKEFNFPDNLKYTKLDEWVKIEGSILTLGITDFAQHQIGDINSVVNFPEIGTEVQALLESEYELTIAREERKSTAFIRGKTVAIIDCSKGEFFVYSPVKGKIIEVNKVLSDIGKGEIVNKDPYGKGWLVKIEILDPSPLETLLDVKAYQRFIGVE